MIFKSSWSDDKCFSSHPSFKNFTSRETRLCRIKELHSLDLGVWVAVQKSLWNNLLTIFSSGYIKGWELWYCILSRRSSWDFPLTDSAEKLPHRTRFLESWQFHMTETGAYSNQNLSEQKHFQLSFCPLREQDRIIKTCAAEMYIWGARRTDPVAGLVHISRGYQEAHSLWKGEFTSFREWAVKTCLGLSARNYETKKKDTFPLLLYSISQSYSMMLLQNSHFTLWET